MSRTFHHKRVPVEQRRAKPPRYSRATDRRAMTAGDYDALASHQPTRRPTRRDR